MASVPTEGLVLCSFLGSLPSLLVPYHFTSCLVIHLFPVQKGALTMESLSVGTCWEFGPELGQGKYTLGEDINGTDVVLGEDDVLKTSGSFKCLLEIARALGFSRWSLFFLRPCPSSFHRSTSLFQSSAPRSSSWRILKFQRKIPVPLGKQWNSDPRKITDSWVIEMSLYFCFTNNNTHSCSTELVIPDLTWWILPLDAFRVF